MRRHLSAAIIFLTFIVQSFFRLPLRSWLRFWFTKDGTLPPENGVLFHIRNTFPNKFVDAHMVWSCVFERQYHPVGFELHKGETVIDIGSHIGAFAIPSMKSVGLKGRVLAYEPSPQNFPLLVENMHLNNVRNIKAFQEAVAGKNGVRTIYFDPANSAMAGLFSKNSIAHKVRAVTLNEIFLKQKITCCDFLKIDCEGAEYEIIENTTPNVFSRIKRIVLEYHNPPFFGLDIHTHSFEKLKQRLIQNGFIIRVEPYNSMRGLLYCILK